MGEQERYCLTIEEELMLLDILFSQKYALELVSCELSDIENGDKKVTVEEYQKLTKIFDKLLLHK
jgi:hypothetical protein